MKWNLLVAGCVLAMVLSAGGCMCGVPLAQNPNPDGTEDPGSDNSSATNDTDAGDLDAGPAPCVDADGDGAGTGAGCVNGPDCDDSDPAIGSSGTRTCSSGSSAGVGTCVAGTQTCTAGSWGPCEGEVLPVDETCDGLDNNCDGATDENLAQACYSGPEGTENVGVCHGGTQSCSGGAFGACEGEVLPSDETCDGLDNNCNGQSDEDLIQLCYSGPEGTADVGQCKSGTQTCASGAWGTCEGEILPGTEVCDGIDNDCNAEVDENTTRVTIVGADQQLAPVVLPVDIILVVSNAASMSDEIADVRSQIDVNLATWLAGSGLDYRVIVLSDFGTTGQQLCVNTPLGGDDCANLVSSCPTNTATFFHYPVQISSQDPLGKILDTYNTADPCGAAPGGWADWLRPNARKLFVVISDDGPSNGGNPHQGTFTNAGFFQSKLYQLSASQFGDELASNILMESIVGLKENTNPTDAWLPADPVTKKTCSGNSDTVVSAGEEFQKVSVDTGGLRYPICQYQSFDAIFSDVSKTVQTPQVSCDLAVDPGAIPTWSSLADTTLELIPTSGTARRYFTQVTDATACGTDNFYVDGTTLRLCPDACTKWNRDALANIDVVFHCSPVTPPTPGIN